MREEAVPSLLAGLIERLLARESLELEFKLAEGGLPRSLWETVSAFANTRGGWIILGVDESGSVPRTVGVKRAHTKLQNFYDSVRNKLKVNYPVCGADDASIELLAGVELIVIRVPEMPRSLRPVYINGNPMTGTYVRRHGGDYRCTEAEVRRMFREAGDTTIDSTVLPTFTWDDLDEDALARYRRRFQTWNPGHVWNGYDDRHFLEALGGFGKDRESGRSGITVAALLMFGKEQAIREWRKRHLIDFRDERRAPDIGVRWTDRVAWEANLLGAFESIYPRLTADLPRPFRLQGATRIDEGPAHEAMREALVNLLVHADYAETDASLVVRSDDGFQFRNPGNSRVLETDLLSGRDRSDPRNPTILRMFRLIGLADEAGTGIPKIISAWREFGFQMPTIIAASERYEFELQFRHAHFLSEEDRAWLRSLGDAWTEAEQLALVLAKHEGDVDNLRLRRLSGQHPTDATRTLGSLRDRGYLQMIGGKRGARYELGAAGLPDSAERIDAGEPSMHGKAPRLPDSTESIPDSGVSMPDSEAQIGAAWDDLVAIARPARERRRLTTETRDAILVRLCARVPLGVEHLASLTQRRENHIRDAVRGLVNVGRLRFLYPEHPRHPRQRYTAAADSRSETNGVSRP